MPGMLDDLIPPQRQLISPNMFADLIPPANRNAAQPVVQGAPIEIEGSDGPIVSFPAGTPHEVMTAAMARHYGSPNKPSPDLSGYSDAQLQQMLTSAGGTDLSRYSDAELHQMLQAQGGKAGHDDSWYKDLPSVQLTPQGQPAPSQKAAPDNWWSDLPDAVHPLTIKPAPGSVGAGTIGGAVAGAPEAFPGSAQAAFGHGVASGVPIIGPYIASGADHLAAGIRSLARARSTAMR